MLSKEQIKKIENNRKVERYTYLGILSDYQTLTSKNLVQTIVYTELTAQQIHLFKRVLHGLNAFDQKDVEVMHWDKKRRVKKVWRKGQRLINRWKQVICNKRSNEIFKLFHSSSIGKSLVNTPVDDVDDKFINTMSLKTLGIKYEDLIIKFYSEGLLPRNFFTLK